MRSLPFTPIIIWPRVTFSRRIYLRKKREKGEMIGEKNKGRKGTKSKLGSSFQLQNRNRNTKVLDWNSLSHSSSCCTLSANV